MTAKNYLWIIKQKRNTILVLIWAVILTLIIVRSHWTLYQYSERLRHYRIAFSIYEAPHLGTLDIVILLPSTILIVMALSDIKPIFYGFIAAHVIAFCSGLIYISLFIWYVLDYQALYSLSPFGWEYVMLMGLYNLFYIMFPWMIGVSILGTIISFILRGAVLST